MNFSSDNWSGATPAVMDAVIRANAEPYAPAYGDDAITASLTRTFSAIFERDVEVWLMSTGTAANGISMAAAARASGFAFCTAEAHLYGDEYNGPEFLTGMKLVGLPSTAAILDPGTLTAALARLPKGHVGPPAVLSITNASEYGTVYSAAETAALAAIAKASGMAMHVDGARFANAVAATGSTPADLSWRAGVDLMSFGGTKNGCLAADAIVVFTPGTFPDLEVLRQRVGHGMSKTRFFAAQFAGYFAEGGWLRTAAHANAMAARLRRGLKTHNAVRFDWESTANELFPIFPNEIAARLRAAGARFHTWDELPEGEQRVRLVTSWSTTEADVDAFLAAL